MSRWCLPTLPPFYGDNGIISMSFATYLKKTEKQGLAVHSQLDNRLTNQTPL